MFTRQINLSLYLLRGQKQFRIQVIDFHHLLSLLFHCQISLFTISRHTCSIIIIHIFHLHIRLKTHILLEKLQILIYTSRQTNPEILVQQIDIGCHLELTIHLSDNLLAIRCQCILFHSSSIIIASENRTRSHITN